MDVRHLKIKAVLFDLGNTLVKVWVTEVVFHRVLSSLGITKSLEEIKPAIVKTELDFKNLGYRSMYGKLPYEEYWSKWNSFVLKNLDVPENERLAEMIQAKWYDHTECEAYPDAHETIHKLKQTGLKTGLVSTGYEEDIHAILERSGLKRELFEVIVGANTIGREKPHPAVFRYALKSLGVKSQEALFVGDVIDADYRGAENVGMKAILIRRRRVNTNEVDELRTITSLQEIFAYMN
ncbi:HAD-IA family hydrolase [Candidatus Bathyarchaeota archaeon]|nr:HAD-IA family hydrolase [Candidatus Bathyarchaeota archaeon]